MDAPTDPTLEALWQAVEAGWSEKLRHDAFIEASRQLDALPAAAARYRAVADGDQARREEAKRRLAAIALVAMSALQTVREPRAPGPPRWLTVLVVVGTIALVLFVLRMVAR